MINKSIIFSKWKVIKIAFHFLFINQERKEVRAYGSLHIASWDMKMQKFWLGLELV